MEKEKIGFVIMPFKPELKEVYEHIIKPAVEECGFTCIRADECSEGGNINRTIIEYLYKSDVVIADLTGLNPNVFYELGIAHSLGNKAVMITQNIEEVPFDVRNYQIIVYKQTIGGAAGLKEDLIRKIRNLDKWRTRPSNPVQDFKPVLSVKQVNRVNEIEKRVDTLETQLHSGISAKIRQENLANFEMLLSRIEKIEKMIGLKKSEQKPPGIIGKISPSLINAISQKRVVLFTGAGISVSAGMPTASQLQKQVASVSGVAEERTFWDTMASAEAKAGRQELVSMLTRTLSNVVPSRTHALIAKVGFDVIITANFDTLMEDAIRRNGLTCFPVVQPEELAYADNSDVLLLKIHGSIERPDSLMLTTDDYGTFQDRKNLLVQTLTHYFVTRTILFVGYSLKDQDLLEILQDIGEKLGPHKRPAYLVIPRCDKRILKKMERVWPITVIEMSAEKFFETLSAIVDTQS